MRLADHTQGAIVEHRDGVKSRSATMRSGEKGGLTPMRSGEKGGLTPMRFAWHHEHPVPNVSDGLRRLERLIEHWPLQEKHDGYV